MAGSVFRLSADGTRDASFGENGAAPQSYGDHMTLAADGSIYVGREVHEELDFGVQRDTETIRRFTPDGDVDATYGANGATSIIVTGKEQNNDTRAFHVEPDGTVYHFFETGDFDAAQGLRLTVLNPAGAVATSYDYDVLHASSPNFLASAGEKIGVQPDGKIVLVSTTDNDTGWMVTRLNTDGSIDRTYGANGQFVTDLHELPDISFPQVLPDGDVLVGGKKLVKTGTFQVVRIDAGEGESASVTLNARGTLIVTGTSAAETASVYIRSRDGRLVARVGDTARSFAPSKVKRIALFLMGGNDALTIGAGVRGAYVDAGDGADTLNGGTGGDLFFGGTGGDQLFGNDGDDTLLGGGGNDYVLGGAGKDDVFGNGGVDTLSGAGGNDRLFGGPKDADRVLGGAGTDSAADDVKDTREGIESLLTTTGE